MTEAIPHPLSSYGLLAGGTLTTTTGPSAVNNGAWAGNAQAITGTLTGSNNTTDRQLAIGQLELFINTIKYNAERLDNTVDITGQTTPPNPFLPDTYYDTNADITYANKTLTFNGSGRYYIRAGGGINLSACTFVLQNGATANNIYFLTDYFATITNPTGPTQGLLVAYGDITLTVPTPTDIFNGVIYSRSSITINGSATINTTLPDIPLVGICFPGDTPIKTDQGIIAIACIIPNFHTIGGERIVAITKTRGVHDFLMCFQKDSCGKNCPSSKTIMSPNHKILLNGKMIKAGSCLQRMIGASKIKYTGEPLYNILMEEHRTISVNNLICETLDPKNRLASVFERIYNDIPAEIVCAQ